MLAILVEEVGHREVVKFQAHATDDARLSPTQRELNLVIRLLLQVPVHVHRSVFSMRLHVGAHLLGVEMSHRGQFARRTHDCVFREEVARLRAQLTTNNILIEAVVSVDAHTADMRLRSFKYAHLEVDRVAHDVHFSRVELIKQVSVVPILITYGIVVFREAFLHQLLVIHVTLFHSKDIAQSRPVAHAIGRINGIAHPRDVAQVVFLTFVHFHIDVHMLVIVVPNTIFHNDSIAESVFVVFVDKVLLVFLPALRRVLLRLKEIGELACLVRLREGTFGEESSLDFLFAQLFVAIEHDVAYLHLLLLVHDDIEYHVVLLADIVALQDFDFGILEAFVVEILLRQHLGAVNGIRMYAHAFQQAQLLLHILTFTLLQTNIIDGRNTRTGCECDVQPDAVAHDRISRNTHIRE